VPRQAGLKARRTEEARRRKFSGATTPRRPKGPRACLGEGRRGDGATRNSIGSASSRRVIRGFALNLHHLGILPGPGVPGVGILPWPPWSFLFHLDRITKVNQKPSDQDACTEYLSVSSHSKLTAFNVVFRDRLPCFSDQIDVTHLIILPL